MACKSCGGRNRTATRNGVSARTTTVWKHTYPNGGEGGRPASVNYYTEEKAKIAQAKLGGTIEQIDPRAPQSKTAAAPASAPAKKVAAKKKS